MRNSCAALLAFYIGISYASIGTSTSMFISTIRETALEGALFISAGHMTQSVQVILSFIFLKLYIFCQTFDALEPLINSTGLLLPI
jgi:hypothetical protein